jgi:Ca-activated chloride channel homolog
MSTPPSRSNTYGRSQRNAGQADAKAWRVPSQQTRKSRSDEQKRLRQLAELQAQQQQRKARWLRGLGVAFLSLVCLGGASVYPWLALGTEWLHAEWQHAWIALGLLPLPLLLWWVTFGQDARRPRLRIGTLAGLQLGPRGWRARLRDLPGIMRCVALATFVLALARPVQIIGADTRDDEGIDIVVAIDLSKSMAAILDSDIKTLRRQLRYRGKSRPSRLDTAKLVVRDFISRRKSDRIGAIVFGRSAYVLSPPTLDYQLLSKLIGQLRLNVINGNRTAIGDAIGTAVARLELSPARSKVIILLTDGENNAGRYAPEEAIREAARVGCKTYTVQIGNGEAVDMLVGQDPFGQPIYQPRVVPVNPKLLKRIADQTGGKHFIATDAKGLAKSMHAILDQLEKTKFESAVSHHRELFPFFLLPGVLLIACEALLRAWLLRRFP